ncbi:MAG TPA: copper-binding protein [Ideonella sp.]|uniref:copper-binding protein n=1 Tax=Ideonella sp. TaxID=1929293 RepID=UPI002BE9A4D7|nr:copper-binding protein [Ideonella sp.]HSI51119.1 copper-binding protein [Ideonella sp.]
MSTWTPRWARMLTGLSLAGLALVAHATDGEIRKIDTAQAKVTIKSGAIKNLDMPAMTMVFKARQPSLLNGLAEGDLVVFEADKVDGQYTVTAIRKK